MMPVLFSLGPITLYSGGLFLILSWCVGSFIFWRIMRSLAVSEEKIFDFMFYMTIVAFVFARLGYVLLHPEVFSHNFVKVFALWVAPGLWFYSAFVGMVIAALYLSKKLKVRMAYIVDALAVSIAASGVIASLGTLLEGSEVGKLAKGPLRVLVVGHAGLRHPYGLYEAGIFVVLCLVLIFVRKYTLTKRAPYGTEGIIFFLLMSLSLFFLEFIKEPAFLIKNLSPNQWVLVILFAQSMGSLLVRLKALSVVRMRMTMANVWIRKTVERYTKRRS